MEKRLRQHKISFKNAFAGVYWAFTSQPNFIVHFTVAILAILAGIYVGLSDLEWIIIVLTIVWGLSAEMINTAIETLSDLITKEWSEEIKRAKDVSAGMMLIVSMGALFVVWMILLPKLVERFLL